MLAAIYILCAAVWEYLALQHSKIDDDTASWICHTVAFVILGIAANVCGYLPKWLS